MHEEGQHLSNTGLSSTMEKSRDAEFRNRQFTEKAGIVILKSNKPHTKTSLHELVLLARQGNQNALERCYTLAKPFIEKLCHTRYFAAMLGTDEARSIALHVMMEFITGHPLPQRDNEIRYLFRSTLRNALLNAINKADVRNRYEVHVIRSEEFESDTDDDGVDAINYIPADSTDEPENHALLKELYCDIVEAFHQLPPKEQAALQDLFFRQKKATALAKELHCSRQYVAKLRDKALRRLRDMLDGPDASGFCPVTV